MDEHLMTRRQVACLFRVTSSAVATWARRGRLPEIRDADGRPRYQRTDVEALFHSGFRHHTAASRSAHPATAGRRSAL
jgi:predicted site-specific integrase-resolvase